MQRFSLLSLAGKALAFSLAGGEDYELVFTAPLSAKERLIRIGHLSGVGVIMIGSIKSEPGIVLVNGKGETVPPPGPVFEHFSPDSTGKDG